MQAFLLFPDEETPTWSHTLSESRSAYTELRAHFLRHLEHPEELESTVDPLADDDEAVSNSIACLPLHQMILPVAPPFSKASDS